MARPTVRRGRLRHLGQPEIEHLHRTVRRHLNVPRFQIAVHHSFFMRGLQRLGDLIRNGQRLPPRNGSTCDPFCQRRAFHQFHDYVIRSNVVERADVRVIQRSHRPRLTLEAPPRLRFMRHMFRQHLDGYVSTEARIVGTVHHAHASRSQNTGDAVRTKLGARSKRLTT